MKNFFLILFFLLSFNAFASISIISDLDDTIKITNSGEEIDGAINAFFKNDVFTGMPDFFSATKTYTNELYILSASPKFLKQKITKTLKLKGILFDSLILKNSVGGQSKLDYKVAQIKEVLDRSPDDFIFLGDDVGQDPEAYLIIKGLYPQRVLAIYIHEIQGRKLPAEIVKYWTSFDLFLREYTAGRMLPSWVDQGADLILSEEKMKYIFPHFAQCPQSNEVWDWQLSTEYAHAAQAVVQRLTDYCLSRSSSN